MCRVYDASVTNKLKILYSLHKDYLNAALKTVIKIHENTLGGDGNDVLVFLTGQDEIEDLASLLKRYLEDFESDGDSEQKPSGDIVQNIQGIGTAITSGESAIINGVLVCVLYASLPPEQQMLAFRSKPKGCTRKVILATNIAGTFYHWALFSLHPLIYD